MARNDSPPFQLGTTYDEGGTIDATQHTELEGKVWVFEDVNYAAVGSAKPYRTGMYRTMMCCRNASGAVIASKRFVKMKVDGTGNEFTGQVSGYATTVGECGYPSDEFIVGTIPINALFWVCVGGVAKITSGAAGDTTVAIGEYVIPTTDGKAIGQDTTVAAGAATFAQAQGALGCAVTAVAAINTDFLIMVTRRFH